MGGKVRPGGGRWTVIDSGRVLVTSHPLTTDFTVGNVGPGKTVPAHESPHDTARKRPGRSAVWGGLAKVAVHALEARPETRFFTTNQQLRMAQRTRVCVGGGVEEKAKRKTKSREGGEKKGRKKALRRLQLCSWSATFWAVTAREVATRRESGVDWVTVRSFRRAKPLFSRRTCSFACGRGLSALTVFERMGGNSSPHFAPLSWVMPGFNVRLGSMLDNGRFRRSTLQITGSWRMTSCYTEYFVCSMTRCTVALDLVISVDLSCSQEQKM